MTNHHQQKNTMQVTGTVNTAALTNYATGKITRGSDELSMTLETHGMNRRKCRKCKKTFIKWSSRPGYINNICKDCFNKNKESGRQNLIKARLEKKRKYNEQASINH